MNYTIARWPPGFAPSISLDIERQLSALLSCHSFGSWSPIHWVNWFNLTRQQLFDLYARIAAELPALSESDYVIAVEPLRRIRCVLSHPGYAPLWRPALSEVLAFPC